MSSPDGGISPSDYEQLVHRIRGQVRNVVPPAATVLVVSKGDEELTNLDGRHGWHFPRQPDGKYAGHYPTDSDDAIGRVEELRRAGADYLVLPSTAFWWLDHYEGLRRHLDERYRLLASDADCMIFHLADGQAPRADTELMAAEVGHDQTWEQAMIARLVQGLLPDGAVTAVLGAGGAAAGAPAGCRLWRLDKTVLASERKATGALRDLAAGEAEFLVIPSSAFPLMEEYPALEIALRGRHRFITRQSQVGEIFELAGDATAAREDEGSQPDSSTKPGLVARLLSVFGRNSG